MGTRRQPSKQFLRRLKGNRKPSRADVLEKRPSWIRRLRPSRPSCIRRLRDSDYWLWGELIGFISVVIALFAFYTDLEDRQTQRVVQAWQLITQNAPGNSGKIPALEYLNSGCPSKRIGFDPQLLNNPNLNLTWRLVKDCGISALFVTPKRQESLHGIDLSVDTHSAEVYLHGIELPRAKLHEANLSGADLGYANLTGAIFTLANLTGATLGAANLSGVFLGWADLTGANLRYANLTGADLENANLTEADLEGADLSGANLKGADLSGANFRPLYPDFPGYHALTLSQISLDTACGDEKTKLPEGFTIKTCPEKKPDAAAR